MKEIILLNHNQQIVDEIEKAMSEGIRKIFFTEATGLGKSFVFMYLINKYFKDKKVLYICPTYHIWKNMNSYKEFKYIRDCVDMCCYADFNSIKDHHFDYDVYFIDEAHHLFSDIRGNNIVSVSDSLIEKNKNAYVFAMTATPYFKNKMVGDEFFDITIEGKNIVEAIEEKLLQPINYAIAIDDVTKNLEEYEDADIAKKYNVDTTKTTVSKLMDEYSYVNHWLLYFPRIEELENNTAYFTKHFPEYKIFILHSKADNMENVLDEFEAYEGKAILASVSMILEGVHPKTVGGILSYRNVHSHNLFLQIIGRLGVMNSNISPIFIDIYGSYRNILPPHLTRTNTNEDKKSHNKSKNTNDAKRFNKCVVLHTDSYKLINFSNMMKNLCKPEYSYRGISWINNVDLSRKLGKPDNYVSNYKRKGLSYEQIIDQTLDVVYEEKTYRNISWTSDIDLSKKLGRRDNYVSNHRRKGLSYEQIIDRVLGPIPKEYSYRGLTWINNKDLSRKLGRYDNYVSNYRRKHLSYEKIIDQSGYTSTYRGISWSDDADLSRKINNNVFLLRQRGLSHEQIIDQYLYENVEEKTYRGITWTNDKDLAVKLGKYPLYISIRKRNGLSNEEIIDQFLDCPENYYRGISWTDDKDLSKKLGQYSLYVTIYKRNGFSYEEIIDKALGK
jgi:superfamily II DNA or RNA helicase